MNELKQYGILSGNEIRQRMAKGDIIIHPYNDQQLGPNSYNLRLMDRMLVYTEAVTPNETTAHGRLSSRRRATF